MEFGYTPIAQVTTFYTRHCNAWHSASHNVYYGFESIAHMATTLEGCFSHRLILFIAIYIFTYIPYLFIYIFIYFSYINFVPRSICCHAVEIFPKTVENKGMHKRYTQVNGTCRSLFSTETLARTHNRKTWQRW